MPASRERDLARALAAVLDGVEPAVGEAGALASVLSRAAASARIDVPEAEVERALARSRPLEATRARKRRVRLGLVLAGAAAAAAAAVALVILSPFSRAPGLDVTARAAQALGAADTVLAVTERVRPAEEGTFQESARLGWLDLSEGRAHWTLQVGGRRVAETLVEPGEVRHFLPHQNVVIEASSCAAFATGCSELVDPIAFYREALAAADGTDVTKTVVDGRPAYRLVLPVQSLPDAARIEQVAYIDAETYLPLRFVWRDVPDQGPPRPFAIIDVVSLRILPRDEAPAGAFTLEVPSNVEVISREDAGAVTGADELTLDEARQLEPGLLWLGPEYEGRSLEGIEKVELEGGTAYRLRYGDDLTVWNYTTAVPPDIAARRNGPTKIVPLEGGGVARFYADPSGRAIGELEGAERSAAIVAPDLEKVDVFRALELLAPLD